MRAASSLTRRAVVLGCGSLVSLGAVEALAQEDAQKDGDVDLPPLASVRYQPQDRDEQGLWMVMAKQEKEIQDSQFRMTDPVLNDYLTELMGRLAGDYRPDVRVYVVRIPFFNASMAPNGMMLIWSGLLLRCQNEAQLAAVLGHELGHYLRQHSIQQWRYTRKTGGALNFIMIGLALAGAGGFAQLAQLAAVSSVFSHSREGEREADRYGLQLLRDQGLDPRAAAQVWESLEAERLAAAKARGRDKPESEPLIFSTHPRNAERMTLLAAAGQKMVAAGAGTDTQAARYAQVMAPHRALLFEDQIKLNDFGATEYLLKSQAAQAGWTAELHHWYGELFRRRGGPTDWAAAIREYQAALALPNPLVASHRGLGYCLLKTGQKEPGQRALRVYLQQEPAATDRALVELSL